MKKRSTLVSSLIVMTLSGACFSAYAQQDTQTDNHTITVTIPVVALLDLEAPVSKNFAAEFTKPANDEAGNKIVAPTANTSLWLNYTSIQTANTTKKVNVKASAVIDGLDIHLVAAAATTGAGTKGTPTAGFNLSTDDQVLISNIGSAYTASGPNNGHQLTYTFIADDTKYADLRSGITPVTVTYTLADN
nr:hypothetical protein [uncultured Dyadobacter sp.]